MARCISQRRNLETIFNSLTDGLVAVDGSLRVMNLNTALLEMTGLNRENALGARCSDLFPPPKGHRSCVLASALERGEMVQGHPIQIRRPNGELRHLTITTHALEDDAGSPQGLVAIVKDRTEVHTLQIALRGPEQFERMIGKNHLMREIYELVDDIGDSDATVLITGESGTGKELVAQAIHDRSHRRSGPFVKVNCSALSEGLLESELFGHVKGAFTGAIRDKVGRFELADGGSIFLDEIGDISPAVQLKLLRVLQEREFERVGGTETVKVNVRVVAATNRDLDRRRREGEFREDLYYRLYVVPIELPPLRRRREDVPLLVDHFADGFESGRERRSPAYPLMPSAC
jgi:PAS domain S-box-containing protein